MIYFRFCSIKHSWRNGKFKIETILNISSLLEMSLQAKLILLVSSILSLVFVRFMYTCVWIYVTYMKIKKNKKTLNFQ